MDNDQHVPSPNWVKYLVAAGAVIALLLLGAAGGLLVGLPEKSGSSAAPERESVDVGFAQDMSHHHDQAVTMATWLVQHTADNEIKQLAFDIETGQLEQIGRMRGWLALWDQPELPSGGKYMAWMSGGGHAHGGEQQSGTKDMPGMATQEELTKLRSLSGKDLDVYFLQLMLRHHVGGGPMIEYGAKHAALPAVRTLAQAMERTQGPEIELMRKLLAERGAQPLPDGN
ncbi:DUF305 domain-containing protein [Pseudonocardiaceae bacterium YIM PH 21723]|nr:DUF305 domain-containing protein [Pseudonocardiaceae bacterium YIM PH 21723]